jgi:hypothetical protein
VLTRLLAVFLDRQPLAMELILVVPPVLAFVVQPSTKTGKNVGTGQNSDK